MSPTDRKTVLDFLAREAADLNAEADQIKKAGGSNNVVSRKQAQARALRRAMHGLRQVWEGPVEGPAEAARGSDAE